MTTPERPDGVPIEAVWSEKDQEWVRGPHDDAGKFHGVVEYWRSDGTLGCRCPHEHGKPHGESRRFHEGGAVSQTCNYVHGVMHGKRSWFATDGSTTEKMHTPDMGENIRRSEVDYVEGGMVAFRFFDGEGREVTRRGALLDTKPPGVPATAQLKDSSTWVDARFRADGEPDGRSRSWDTHGALIAEEHFQAGKRHGLTTLYDFRHGGARVLAASYDVGRPHGSYEAFWPDGSLRRRTRFEEGNVAAPLEDWDREGKALPPIMAPPVGPTAPVASPTPEEQAILGTLTALEGRLPKVLPDVLSPQGLAVAIATGWGGDDDRDAEEARGARALVRKVGSPALTAKLRELGIERVPRLLTEARVERVLAGLGASEGVDGAALARAFIDRGGPSVAVGLALGGSVAMGLLETKRHERRLDLQGLALTQAPTLLAHFPEVHELELSRNKLTTLPREVGGMVHVRDIQLGGNRITSLPEELERLVELRRVDLDANHLKKLPPGLCRLRTLDTLNLGQNQLAKLPPEFGDLDQLGTLWLNDNPLTTLPREITKLRRLNFLHLGEAEWSEPPPWLFEMESLEDLWLASTTLTRLPPEIARLPKLHTLCVWYSNLESVPEELFGMTRLKELRIGNNPLPDAVIPRLREALPSCTIY